MDGLGRLGLLWLSHATWLRVRRGRVRWEGEVAINADRGLTVSSSRAPNYQTSPAAGGCRPGVLALEQTVGERPGGEGWREAV